MMLPGCTSGRVKVFARYFTPLALTMVFSNALPSKLTMLPSGWMVRARRSRIFTFLLLKGSSTLASFVPSCVKILMRTYSRTEDSREFMSLERYRIIAFAPGLAGLSFSARSAGGTGSQSSPAEEGRGALATPQSTLNAKALAQKNRWVRFMAKHAPKLLERTGGRAAGMR